MVELAACISSVNRIMHQPRATAASWALAHSAAPRPCSKWMKELLTLRLPLYSGYGLKSSTCTWRGSARGSGIGLRHASLSALVSHHVEPLRGQRICSLDGKVSLRPTTQHYTVSSTCVGCGWGGSGAGHAGHAGHAGGCRAEHWVPNRVTSRLASAPPNLRN